MSKQTDAAREPYDVAIVGYGPVGALTALLLADQGLRVAVVERSRDVPQLPRAVGLDGESVRACQRLGFADRVNAILQPPREKDEVTFTDSKRNVLFGLEIPKQGWNGWRDIAFFDQPELEALLRGQVAEDSRIDVFLGVEVVGLEQSPEGVLVRCAANSPQGPEEIRAAYGIGSDGASSFVRRAAGIEWTSLGYDQDWLVVDIVQKPEAELPLRMMQVCDPARLTTYVCVKDPNRRWEFQLIEGETREEMERPDKVRELLDPWLPREHYEICRAVVYQFHAATASCWREGRVFLAGDAAHQTPPFLGQGLNAGLRDAVNLAWKIPLVLSGLCEERLLESYAAERDAHARDLVEWAVAIGKLMETLAAREAGLPDPHASTDPSAGYGQGRTVPPLRDGVIIREQAGEGRSAGGLMRQPRVRGESGEARWLDELLGGGFAVLGRKPGDLRMGPEAEKILARLGARVVCLDGLEVIEGAFDSLFDRHPAAVIRPDRYVFGAVDEEWSLDRLMGRLALEVGLR